MIVLTQSSHYFQSAEGVRDTAEKIFNGTATPWDYLNVANAGGWFAGKRLGSARFEVGTSFRTSDGSKSIEQLKKGDLLLSRHEDGPIEVKEVFVRESALLSLGDCRGVKRSRFIEFPIHRIPEVSRGRSKPAARWHPQGFYGRQAEGKGASRDCRPVRAIRASLKVFP